MVVLTVLCGKVLGMATVTVIGVTVCAAPTCGLISTANWLLLGLPGVSVKLGCETWILLLKSNEPTKSPLSWKFKGAVPPIPTTKGFPEVAPACEAGKRSTLAV